MQLAEAQQSTMGALVVNEMRMLYGSKFAQQWQGLTARELKDSWDQKLSGLGERDVRRGLVACLRREWPPTLPEFLRLCCPWMDTEVAYHEAVHGMSCRRRGEMGEWSHPAVYWAAVAVSSNDLLNSTYGSIKGRWEKTLIEEMEKGTWKEIPKASVALPAPKQTAADRVQAAKALKAMGAEKALDQAGKDPRRWIAKWDERIAKGEVPSPTIAAMLKKAKGEES